MRKRKCLLAGFVFMLVFLCGSISAFAEDAPSGWRLEGNASYSDGEFTITEAAASKSGGVFYEIPLDLRSDSWEISFEFYMGDSSKNLEGILIVFGDSELCCSNTRGASMGYNDYISGESNFYGIELDTYQNDENNDIAAQHIAVVKNSGLDRVHLDYMTGFSLTDGVWHTMSLVYNDDFGGMLYVYLDDNIALASDQFDPTDMSYFGFTASTNLSLYGYQKHAIRNIEINCEEACLITLDANGGSCDTTSLYVLRNSEGTLPTPMLSGYTFEGWYTEPEGGTKVEGTNYDFAEGQTLYAHWVETTYIVIFAGNGGIASTDALTVKENATISTLPTATRTGYTFLGWYTAQTGGTELTTSTPITEDVMYYAQWQINTYTVTFDANGGTVSSASSTVNYNDTISALPTATRTGYTFLGWYTAKTGGTKLTTSTKITAAATYFAQWSVNSYTVSFDANGGSTSASSRTVTYQSTLSSLPTATRSHYTFKGWYTAKSGGTKLTTSTKITGNVTYYAQWTIKSYKVTFNANGGKTSTSSKTVKYNNTISTLPTPTRSGYTFMGWYTKKSGGTKLTTSTKITKKITYYAQWKKNVKVTFKGNGGTASVSSKTVKYNGKISSLPTAKRSGYTFMGWYTKKSGGTKLKTSTKLTKNVTYYAQWKKNVKVTFKGNGGTASVSSKTVKYNGTISSLPTAKRSGYTFMGWYTAKSGGTKLKTSTKLTKNVTYYAQWKKNVKVTFNGNGGTASKSSKTVKYNGTISTLPTAERSGYTFDGWYTKKSGGTELTTSTKLKKDITYYAHWTKNSSSTSSSGDSSTSDSTSSTSSSTGSTTGSTSSSSSSSTGHWEWQTVEVDCPSCVGGRCSICNGTGSYRLYGKSVSCSRSCSSCGGSGTISQKKYVYVS